MRIIGLSFLLSFLVACQASNVGSQTYSVFSVERFATKYLESEDLREALAAERLLEYYNNREADSILDKYLKEEFVFKNVPFVLLDNRSATDVGESYLFAPGDHDVPPELNFLTFHKIKDDQGVVWNHTIDIGQELSKFRHIDSRTSGGGKGRALLVLVYDGMNLNDSVFVGYAAFSGGQSYEQESFLKYLSFSELIRCLMYSSAWDGSQLHGPSMMLLDADFELIKKYCEGVNESEQENKNPADPFK